MTSTHIETLLATPRMDCGRCKGAGTIHRDGFIGTDGRAYPARDERCIYCEGRGYFEAPNLDAIVAGCLGRKGLRSKRPTGAREYYVWRMARFHGGLDVTMPVMALCGSDYDPYTPVLEALSSALARRVCGTDLAAAHRWGRALGWLDRDMGGLPATAYPCGPVTDGLDPDTNTMIERDIENHEN